MIRPASFASCALSMLTVVLVACGGSSPPPTAPNDKLGEVVRFALQTDEGVVESVPVAGARATVVGVFGPKCGRCKDVMPALAAKQMDLAKRGAKLVLVGVLGRGESPDDAKRALSSWGVSSPFLVDLDGTTKREAEIEDLPAVVVFDRDGKIRWVAPDDATADDIVAAAQ